MRTRWLIPLPFITIALFITLLFAPATPNSSTAHAQDDLAARVADLEAQVDALTDRLDAIENAVGIESEEGSLAVATDTPAPAQPAGATANQNANLRGGPSTTYAITGSVSRGQALAVEGCNQACDWYQLASGNWIAAFLVDNAPEDLEPVSAPVQSTPADPTNTPTTAPATIAPATSAPANDEVCGCSGNLYNCSDFDTHNEAQACFAYCQDTGAGDIHRLDSDDDGDACESLR